jgi:hypothetical protein
MLDNKYASGQLGKMRKKQRGSLKGRDEIAFRLVFER